MTEQEIKDEIRDKIRASIEATLWQHPERFETIWDEEIENIKKESVKSE